ncbi:MAG: tRNA pseudouridine(38-40) synthase TruA [Chloroflexota bacterium]
MRIGFIVEYDGSELHGSQLQANVRTVQGELEEALGKLFERHVRVRLASRTDAGVHAEGQVAAFDIENTDLAFDTIREALNFHLPADVAVLGVAVAPEDFRPRSDATGREYTYTVLDRPARSPLLRRRVAHVRSRLDTVAMAAAAELFEGTHDFASFAGPAVPRDAATVRIMEEASVKRHDDSVVFRMRGNAFLHQQVRRMTGLLLEVGRHRADKGRVSALLEAPRRGTAGSLAPAQGLCLTRVIYPGAGPSGLPGAENTTETNNTGAEQHSNG